MFGAAALFLSVLFSARIVDATEFKGQKGFIGNGSIRTFVEVEGDDPVAVGVEFDEKMLTGLPQGKSDGAWDIIDADGTIQWSCCGHEVVLEFHPQAKELIPFNHFVMNWNPQGHSPPGIYNVPHFDFHFYTIDVAARESIAAPSFEEACPTPAPFVPVTCDDLAILTAPLPCDEVPPDYSNVAAVEPGMGNHLIDFSSAEFTSSPFSHTWIFGSLGGHLSFWEPMITISFLNQVKNFKSSDAQPSLNGEVFTMDGKFTTARKSIKVPAAAPEAGWYPQEYSVSYRANGKKFRVTLDNMVYLPASTNNCSL